jgi:hypothetical protein
MPDQQETSLTAKEQALLDHLKDPTSWGARDELKKTVQVIVGALIPAVCGWWFQKPWLFLVSHAFLITWMLVLVGSRWEMMKTLPGVLQKLEGSTKRNGQPAI